MAPHRLVFFLTIAVGLPTLLTFFSLLHSHPRGKLATEDEPKSGLRAFFSFHTPSALFPPSAIISLTDDNSTFFLARPADFGPSLASNGLSGQLWIGNGFGEDDMGRSGAGSGAEGELGCSDVPGWDDTFQRYAVTVPNEQASPGQGPPRSGLDNHAGDAKAPKASRSEDNGKSEPSMQDGTDDHLHHPLPSSPVTKPLQSGQSNHQEPDRNGHADIQSLQETAEITGKVALLSRGGCGFLEKVKWAQRRGASALIVGDNTRGGALVTMYARGDTSNITIPSVFTSHTTAHLLSSLIPPEDDDDAFSNAQGGGSLPGGDSNLNADGKAGDDKPTFTPGSRPRATSSVPRASALRRRSIRKLSRSKQTSKSGWLTSIRRLFSIGKQNKANRLHPDSRRPPSSGRLGLWGDKQKDQDNKDSKASTKTIASARSTPTNKDTGKGGSHPGSGDDFVIGVQDWRDPDLMKSVNTKSNTKSTTWAPFATQAVQGKAGKEVTPEQQTNTALTGGSITPGSGEYQKAGEGSGAQSQMEKGDKDAKDDPSNVSTDSNSMSDHMHQDLDEEHEGLWVTLTPTTMSTSPFFDTLLVLVVSPLVTLTVVYALLLLRSRIRRRRWRAPKSVVDRLPVRTYHTMSGSSTPSTVRYASSHNSSPTSPLLQSGPRPSGKQKRPRAATASGVGDAVSASLDRATARASILQNEKELTAPVKRKKYHSRQIECVVCLEEYVDGHSRVMSLPCGHEFHAECMYVVSSLITLHRC